MRIGPFEIKRVNSESPQESRSGNIDEKAYYFLNGTPATHSGERMNETLAHNLSAVFNAITIISGHISSLPLIVYRRKKDGGKERATDHPLYDALQFSPNEDIPSSMWKQMVAHHIEGWGNHYSYIYRDNYRDIAFYPLLPDKTKREKLPNGRWVYYTEIGKNYYVLPSDVILHIPGLSYNGIDGLSTVSYARHSLGLASAAEKFGGSLFKNGTRVSGVLEHPKSLKDKATMERLRESWNQAYGGVDNANKVPILEEGMKFQQTSINPDDAQFLETRKFQIEEVARWFNIPPHKIKQLDRATFSNIEHQDLEYIKDSLLYRLVRIESQINKKLFTKDERKEYFAEFLVDGLLRGDTKTRYDAYAMGRQWGWMSANDVRRLENMDPIGAQGDAYMVPMNMIDAKDLSTHPEEEKAPSEEDLRKITNRLYIKGKEYRESKRSAASRRRYTDRYKKKIQEVTQKIIDVERAKLLEGMAENFESRGVADFKQWVNDFYRDFNISASDIMKPVLTAYADALLPILQEEIGSEEDLDDRYQEYTKNYIDTFGVRYAASSRTQLEKIIREEPPADVQNKIEETIEKWKNERAEDLARDESIRAESAFAKMAFSAMAITKIMSVAYGDNCPYCTALDGKIIKITQNFIEAGEEFQPEGAERPLVPTSSRGHPPYHVACNCGIVARR